MGAEAVDLDLVQHALLLVLQLQLLLPRPRRVAVQRPSGAPVQVGADEAQLRADTWDRGADVIH